MFSSESKSLEFDRDSFQLYEKRLEQDEQYLNNKIRVIMRKCCDVVYKVYKVVIKVKHVVAG